jgi:general secretion pathway protein F
MGITAAEIIAVHEEIATLVQAGVPLEAGLASLARDVPRHLRGPLQTLADRLAQGASLATALRDSQLSGHNAYAAVFGAALRSPQPARLLEALVTTARRSQEFRQSLVIELFYPFVVLLVGLAFISFAALKTTPVIGQAGEYWDVAAEPITQTLSPWLQEPQRTMLLQGLTMGGLLAIACLAWQAGRTVWSRDTFLWPFGSLRRASATAIFYDVLALLLESEQPLVEALPLAGEATASRQWSSASRAWAEQLARGSTASVPPLPLPALLSWQLQLPPGSLVAHLRSEASRWREVAERKRHWFTTWLPMLTTLGVGVFCVAVLAVLNLGTFVYLLIRVAQPGLD